MPAHHLGTSFLEAAHKGTEPELFAEPLLPQEGLTAGREAVGRQGRRRHTANICTPEMQGQVELLELEFLKYMSCRSPQWQKSEAGNHLGAGGRACGRSETSGCGRESSTG